jgi:hypothetical protein
MLLPQDLMLSWQRRPAQQLHAGSRRRRLRSVVYVWNLRQKTAATPSGCLALTPCIVGASCRGSTRWPHAQCVATIWASTSLLSPTHQRGRFQVLDPDRAFVRCKDSEHFPYMHLMAETITLREGWRDLAFESGCQVLGLCQSSVEALRGRSDQRLWEWRDKLRSSVTAKVLVGFLYFSTLDWEAVSVHISVQDLFFSLTKGFDVMLLWFS